ncbi:sensor domain-containing protein [Allokutzneria sp. A3M-2-11 16]|uniref:sensor histidine kinase n=1 Tax=Allokutzneria sp. A3M-2-11 16 TaxID=2962043 RepID=UPI0020B8202F|nr:sensor domain-containing protein [Allokutzneria sp. A3M-2-11 16]MCP3800748.1 sensor domain-containing protein [Allokutzneria sp. A3M-2-11 16]
MVRRYTLAMARGVVFAGLAVVGLLTWALVLLALVPVFVGLVFTHMHVVEWTRPLPRLVRRLCGRWSTVDIPDPYRPAPEPVQPEEDGWYRDGDMLYKRGWWLNYQRRFTWISDDPATWRDHLWMLVNGIVGTVLGLLPAAAFGYGLLGFLAPWQPIGITWYAGVSLSLAPVIGLLVMTFGVLSAPHLLVAQGRWNRLLLAQRRPRGPKSRPRVWLGNRLRTIGYGAAVAAFGALGLVLFLAHLLVFVVSLFTGLQTLVWPPLVEAGRSLPNLARARVKDLLGEEIPDPYLPEPVLPRPRPDGKYQAGRSLYRTAGPVIRYERWKWVMSDRATWRDLAWMALNTVVSLLPFLPAVLACIGTFGWVFPWFWEPLIASFLGEPVKSGYALADLLLPKATVLGPLPGVFEPVFGVLLTVLAFVVTPRLLQAYAKWNRLLLAPTQAALLAKRVEALTESRAEASDAQAAELRRIERDLHDGAQARLVAMGLKLGAAEALIERDPAAAKALVAQVREASSVALRELRDLVRGIHPPVLAERGLVDAVRALALDSALDVEVAGVLRGRPEAPVESAAYFGVSEVLANAAKHAEAARVSIELDHDGERLRIVATDDGRGGADPGQGSGLRGIERRFATFDGTFTVDSPVGGPTKVIMELPCVLSSPKTSTSFETA